VKFSRHKKDRPISRASAPKLRSRRKDGADGVPVRVEFGTESSTGVTMMRTPEPLPPSPAAQDAEGWFEQVPTNTADIPDLGALAEGADPDSVPSWAMAPRREPRADERYELTVPVITGHASWFVWLVAATCLAVGMVLGALLYSVWGP
jgi:hypothetical protein